MNDPIAWKSLFAQVRSVTLGLGHKVMVFNSDGKTSEKKKTVLICEFYVLSTPKVH